MNSDSEKSHKVKAAWGPGKLADRPAMEYLKEMLDDPKAITERSFFAPGESFRAALAIAEINGWDFPRNKDSIDDVRRRLQEQK